MMRITSLILVLFVSTPVIVGNLPHAEKPEKSVKPPVVASPPVATEVNAESSEVRPSPNPKPSSIVSSVAPAMDIASKSSKKMDSKIASAPASKSARPHLKLMSAAREAKFRNCFPRVNDPEFEAILDDPGLIIYSEAEMPKAYQFFDGAFPGVHSVNYNISANGSEPFGNGNREFPWSSPAGTHRSSNVNSFRFFLLPKDSEGRFRPVVWHKAPTGGAAYSWTFPLGTVFGEVLMLRGPDRRDYTFEVRIRRREAGYWEVDAYRPFPTAKSLAERIKELRPDWEQNANLAQVCEHLQGPRKLTPFMLADTQPQVRTFKQWMGVDTLPAIEDQKLVAELLSNTTFESASGLVWRESKEGVKTCAPTTKAAFHIVPANYDAGFVAVDHKSCMRCHNSVNESVRKFDAGRDWYGNIRGSDGIFSFHPFAPESISHNGFAQGVRLRREFEQAGILEKFDPARHSHKFYQALNKTTR